MLTLCSQAASATHDATTIQYNTFTILPANTYAKPIWSIPSTPSVIGYRGTATPNQDPCDCHCGADHRRDIYLIGEDIMRRIVA
ncbi:hypothetical protein Hamer_G011753 [Homarus americanus]|uniref:Uncharacterized protein n=1 Tax=Homarus americanus TaxID=6706 RepID=A0A8J5K390_HOMAM|nr:hypothetical protein Hamer_G011753 [Homarus americanus]